MLLYTTLTLFFEYSYGRGPRCRSFDPCPPGLQYAWTHIGSTSFRYFYVDDLFNYEVSCPPERGVEGSMAFYEISHFLSFPTPLLAEEVGTQEALMTKLAECRSRNGNQTVSAISVDFWTKTELPQVVQRMNAAMVAASMSDP